MWYGIYNRVKTNCSRGDAVQVYSGSEAGLSLRLIGFVYHSTLGLRVIKKKGTGLKRCGTETHTASVPLQSVGIENQDPKPETLNHKP